MAILCIALLPCASTPAAIVCAIGSNFSVSALVTLLDTLLLTQAEADPGIRYHRIRSMGVIAQAIGILGLGMMLDQMKAVFWICGAAALVGLLPLHGMHSRYGSGESDVGLLSVLKRPGILPLVILGVIAGLPIMATSSFAVYIFDEKNISRSLLGAMYAVRIVAQAPGLIAADAIGKRVSHGCAIVLSCALFAVECLCYMLVRSGIHMVLLGTLFGFAYGVYSGAAVKYAAQRVPPELCASALVLCLPFALGVGGMLNGLVGGTWVARMGAANYFVFCAAVALTAAVFFAKRKEDSK